MSTSPDHPDFTALALGEHIHGAPAQAVLEALRTSVSARAEAEQICNTARHLSLILKGQPPLRLDAARRNAILQADPAEIRARFAREEAAAPVPAVIEPPKKPARTWVYPTLAAAAVAGAVVLVLHLLPGYTPGAPQRGGNGGSLAGSTEPPVENGIIMITPAPAVPKEPAPPARRRQTAPEVVQKPGAPLMPPPDKGVDLPPALPPPPAIVQETPPSHPPLPAPAPPAVQPQPAPKKDNAYRDFATPQAPRGKKE